MECHQAFGQIGFCSPQKLEPDRRREVDMARSLTCVMSSCFVNNLTAAHAVDFAHPHAPFQLEVVRNRNCVVVVRRSVEACPQALVNTSDWDVEFEVALDSGCTDNVSSRRRTSLPYRTVDGQPKLTRASRGQWRPSAQ